ncbi:uncharacterized protein LOC120784442 isoform X2 [Xiphias gladius]|uniref:uncharacterized protein LOC120784442 isoform X2 n=1 Tax=Xiphias gladius TaxID=8245 RepID=UPI001A993217|nr:uncharacterized protein LOC120784442 isoform X2 [Xiphias gladius]
MAGALTFLLVGYLLKCAMCGQFQVIMPQTIEVLSGSCGTIPCSFDIDSSYEDYLVNTCTATWNRKNGEIFDHPKVSARKEMTGDLTRKNCTTTFDNMRPEYSNEYFFRLDCQNPLKYRFKNTPLNILVNAVPPSPTLTPSTLEVKEGTSVSLECSAPAPCLSHPPTLTWTPSLGDSQETLQEKGDKTKVKTSVLNFTASHLHHGKTFTCTAVYSQQNGNSLPPVNRSLTAVISFPPQILRSSHCNKTASRLSCSCETVGNPFPVLKWYLSGLPVNQSDKLAVRPGYLNGTVLRSIITVNQPQWRLLSTLVCHSSNSLGTARQHYCVASLEHQTPAGSQGHVTLPVFITTVVALLALICALLFFIRFQRTHHNFPESWCTGDTSRVALGRLLTGSKGNEAPHTTEVDTCVEIHGLRQADIRQPATTSEPKSPNLPGFGPNKAEEASESSENKNGESSNEIYSNLIWRSKRKKKQQEDSVDMDPPGSSSLQEERCIVGGMCRNFGSDALEMGSLYDEVVSRNVRGEAECEYTEVTFKQRSDTHN